MRHPPPPSVVFVSWCPHGHVLSAAEGDDFEKIRSLGGTCESCPPSLGSRKRVTRYRLDDRRDAR